MFPLAFSLISVLIELVNPCARTSGATTPCTCGDTLVIGPPTSEDAVPGNLNVMYSTDAATDCTIATIMCDDNVDAPMGPYNVSMGASTNPDFTFALGCGTATLPAGYIVCQNNVWVDTTIIGGPPAPNPMITCESSLVNRVPCTP